MGTRGYGDSWTQVMGTGRWRHGDGWIGGHGDKGQMDPKDRGTWGWMGMKDRRTWGQMDPRDMGTEGPEGQGDMGTNRPKGQGDTGTNGPEGHGDTGYRDTADRWVGMRGAGLAPRCAPCPVPPAGRPQPRGTQQGATWPWLGPGRTSPHACLCHAGLGTHQDTRVCAPGSSSQPRGYFYPAPLAPVSPTLPQQPLPGRWGTQRAGQRPRCQLHGTARSSQPHSMVISAPQRGHPSPMAPSPLPYNTAILSQG